jgi:hypothetical protein
MQSEDSEEYAMWHAMIDNETKDKSRIYAVESAPLRSILICITFPGVALHNRCFPCWLFIKGILQCLECGKICKRIGWNEHLPRCAGTGDWTTGAKLTYIGAIISVASTPITTMTTMTTTTTTTTTIMSTAATSATATASLDPWDPGDK